jgi:hypothetical protein
VIINYAFEDYVPSVLHRSLLALRKHHIYALIWKTYLVVFII